MHSKKRTHAAGILGDLHGLTLVDKIHMAVLIANLWAMVVTFYDQRALNHGIDQARVSRVNRVMLGLTTLVFIVANAAMIAEARGG